MADKPLSQQYYEAVEKLTADDMSNADAIREVAKKFGKNENAVRGGIHQYRSRHVNGNAPARSRSRGRSPQTIDDHLTAARASLEAAITMIDTEVDQAKAALDAAQARYDEVTASVEERKADLEAKLKALS